MVVLTRSSGAVLHVCSSNLTSDVLGKFSLGSCDPPGLMGTGVQTENYAWMSSYTHVYGCCLPAEATVNTHFNLIYFNKL